MQAKLKLRIIFFVIFCLPGGAIVGYSAQRAMDTFAFTRVAIVTSGTILKYERAKSQGGKAKLGRPMCAVLEFSNRGVLYTFSDSWCYQSPKAYPVGTTLPVVFDPNVPTKAFIHQFWELYGSALILALIGLPWLLIGIALIVRI